MRNVTEVGSPRPCNIEAATCHDSTRSSTSLVRWSLKSLRARAEASAVVLEVAREAVMVVYSVLILAVV